MLTRHRSKVPAVAAVDLSPTHIVCLAVVQNTMDAFDEGTVSGLPEDDHIASLDFTSRKGDTSREDIVTLVKIWPKAGAAHF